MKWWVAKLVVASKDMAIRPIILVPVYRTGLVMVAPVDGSRIETDEDRFLRLYLGAGLGLTDKSGGSLDSTAGSSLDTTGEVEVSLDEGVAGDGRGCSGVGGSLATGFAGGLK